MSLCLALLVVLALHGFAEAPSAGSSLKASVTAMQPVATSRATPVRAAARRRVFRYRVTVNGETRWKRHYPQDLGAGGQVVTKRWSMKFPRVRVVVRRGPGVPVYVGLPGNGTRGSISTHYAYKDDEKFSPTDNRPICDIAGDYPNMAATLVISGNAAGHGNAGRIELRADHARGDVLGSRSRAAANFACPERQPGSPLGYGTDLGPIRLRSGAIIDGHGNIPTVSLVRKWRRPVVRAPLGALLGGRGFMHFETGWRRRQLVNGKPSATAPCPANGDPCPVATCPDPNEPCDAEEMGKRLEITFRRR